MVKRQKEFSMDGRVIPTDEDSFAEISPNIEINGKSLKGHLNDTLIR